MSNFSDFEQKTFAVLAEFFQQGCQNCVLYVEGNNLRNIFLEKVELLLSFSKFGRKRSVSMLENFDKVVKTESYLSRGTFSGFLWKNYIFLSLSEFLRRKLSSFLAETVRQICQVRSLFVQGNILGKNKLFEKKKKCLLDRSRTSSHFFNQFGANDSAGLSKLHTTCPVETLDKSFSGKSTYFSSMSDFERLNKLVFSKNV